MTASCAQRLVAAATVRHDLLPLGVKGSAAPKCGCDACEHSDFWVLFAGPSSPLVSFRQMPHRAAKRILVIDDDRGDVEMLDDALMDAGYISMLAHNGEEAIRLAEILQPDLVLLDLHMPRMNGYEVAAAIRAMPGLERTRIVAVTGAAGEETRVAAAGFDGYVIKPSDPGTFVSAIQAMLSEHAAS